MLPASSTGTKQLHRNFVQSTSAFPAIMVTVCSFF